MALSNHSPSAVLPEMLACGMVRADAAGALYDPAGSALPFTPQSVADGIVVQLGDYCVLVGAGAPASAAQAALTIASGGANNDLTFTAVGYGVAGDAFSVAIVQQVTPSAVAAVTLSGSAATIALPASAPVAASLLVDNAAANSDLTFTAVATGTAGNSLTVTIVQSVTPSAPLSVAYAAPNATITLGADGGGAPVASTANQVKTAWDASAAHAVMTVAVQGSGAGACDAHTVAPLAGGSAGGAPVALTASAAKVLWDASAALAVMTVAVEGSGAGNIAAHISAALAGGVNGTAVGLAGAGSTYTKTDATPTAYINTGTKAVPIWAALATV